MANLHGQVSLEDVVVRIPFGERAPQAAAVLSRLFGLAEVPEGGEVPYETALLVAAVLGARLPEPVEEALVARAAGNPFFLNEIVAMLRGSGTLVQDDRGRWKITGPVAGMLPDTVHGAARARLDRLPPDLRNANRWRS